MKIEITDSLYQRLAKHVEGFETPENVITRILDEYESKKEKKKPEIIFIPNEFDFKEELLKKKVAWKTFEYTDGSILQKKWVATHFSLSSSLKANLWSGSLRDWQAKGISKLTLSVDKLVYLENKEYKLTKEDFGEIEIKVGEFVQKHLEKIVEFCSHNPEHIRQLTDKTWSKEYLGLSSFPFMALAENVKGSVRFWVQKHRINGQEYRFCSQFGGSSSSHANKTLSEVHGGLFMKYLKSNGLLLSEYEKNRIKFIVNKQGKNSNV